MEQAPQCYFSCARMLADPHSPRRPAFRVLGLSRPTRRVSEDQPYAVDASVIDQWDTRLQIRWQGVAIQLRVRYAAADGQGVVDQDFVARRAILVHDLEPRPFFRDARSQEQA